MPARDRLIVVRDEEFCLPILRLSGCVWDRTWEELERAIWQLRDEGHQMIGLDLSDVRYISPLGVLLLRDARNLLAARFQILTITALSPAAILAMS